MEEHSMHECSEARYRATHTTAKEAMAMATNKEGRPLAHLASACFFLSLCLLCSSIANILSKTKAVVKIEKAVGRRQKGCQPMNIKQPACKPACLPSVLPACLLYCLPCMQSFQPPLVSFQPVIPSLPV
jgi:hypothetical protein